MSDHDLPAKDLDQSSLKSGVIPVRPIANKGCYTFTPSFAIPRRVKNKLQTPPPRHVSTRFNAQKPPLFRERHPWKNPRMQSGSSSSSFPSHLPYQVSTATKWVRTNKPTSSTSNFPTALSNLAAPVITKIMETVTVPLSNKEIQNRVPLPIASQGLKTFNQSTISTFSTGPMKPIVRLSSIHEQHKNRKLKKVTSSKYKSPPPIITKKVSHFNAKFSSRFLNSDFVKRSARQSFSVRKYSLKRIRKSSISSNSPKSRRLSVVVPFIGDGFSLLGSPSWRQLSLSTKTPFQMSPSIRRATRVVQRSKKLLNKSKRKQNTFCRFFNKFGSCQRKNEGCPFIHDPRQIQICSTFLATGSCSKSGCSLSHNSSIGKVPSCQFYSKGLCVRKENCPFRHVEPGSSPTALLKKRSSLTKNTSSNEKIIPTIPDLLKLKNKDPTQQHINKDTVTSSSLRYFEKSPARQPIVSIIPRRLRKELNEEVPHPGPSSETGKPFDIDTDTDDEDIQSDLTKSAMSLANCSDSETDDSDSKNHKSVISKNLDIDQFFNDSQEKTHMLKILDSLEPNSSVVNDIAGNASTTNEVDLRRQRLLEKITKFKDKPPSHSDNLSKHRSSKKSDIKMPTFFKFS